MTSLSTICVKPASLVELQKKWFGETYDNLPDGSDYQPEQFHKLAGLNSLRRVTAAF